MDLSVIIAHDVTRKTVDLDGLKCDVYDQLTELDLEGEIIIAEDGSKSSARNSAVDKAKGEILVFLDDDVLLRRHFFQEILDPFKNADVGIVGGVNVAFKEISWHEQISANMMSSPLLWGKSSARYTPRGGTRFTDESELILCCMAIRKNAFQEAGGFPLDVIPCEENVLINRIQKLGWLAVYSPYAIVYHRRAEFPWDYARKLFAYGKGRGIMMRRGCGAPKTMWKPSWNWIAYCLGFFFHFGSYFLGLVYGYLKTWRKEKRRDE